MKYKKIKQYIYTALSLLLLIQPKGMTQKAWTLDQCIQYARKHHPGAVLADNDIHISKIDETIRKKARLPSIGFDSNAGFLFGRNVDPTTNSFNNKPVFYNSFQMDVFMPVFVNGQLKKSVQQSALNTKASQEERKQALQDIQLNVFKAYMNILLAKEQLDKTSKNLAFAEEQLKQVTKLIESGAKARNEALDILAQIAQYKQAVSESRNAVVLRKIDLADAMYHPDYLQLSVKKPKYLSAETQGSTYQNKKTLIEKINHYSPALKAKDYLARSGEIELDLEQISRYPSINLFAGLNSRYSSTAKRVGATAQIMTAQEVIFDGNYTTLEVPQDVPVLERNPYFNQLGQNFGQQLGISIQVPVFDKGISKLNMEKIKIGLSNNRLAKNQLKQQLASTTNQLLEHISANQKNQELIQNRIATIRSSFEKAQQEFQLGVINSFDLFSIKKELELAELELTKSQYELIFHNKILGFYAGDNLAL